MNDWQAALKEVLDKKEKRDKKAMLKVSERATASKAQSKKNRGRGALPLLRPAPRTHRKILIEDDGPPIHNWRRSPMER